MPVLLEEDKRMELPEMYTVRQQFERKKIEDVEASVRCELCREQIRERIKPGMKVAVAVGSRGIRNLSLIVKTLVDTLKDAGALPFIVSAMGSHGGGTEQGQREVLAGYGITGETMGVPVVTSVEVEKIAETGSGIPVYFDAAALKADCIIPVNRVKLHTDFVGELQSGLCKMLVIGLGNHKGCSVIHEEEFEHFSEILEEAAGLILKNARVAFGIAILENGYDETFKIEAIEAENIIRREKELVALCKSIMPTIMLDTIDVLVIEEIGKNISGAGFDPNIVGKSSVLKTFVLHVPKIQKMVLLDLTEESHGNGIGVGLFDVITGRVFKKLDLESMYANAVACKCIDDVKIPLICASKEEAVRVAVKACRNVDRKSLRIVEIKNTLELEYIKVSGALLPSVKKNGRMELCEK